MGGNGAMAPGPPLQGGPRDEIYLFQIKYSFEKILWFRSETRIQLYIIFLCYVKYRGPMGVRKGGKNGHFLTLEIGTKNQKILVNLKAVG